MTTTITQGGKPAGFHWLDLAAADPGAAAEFYAGLCGWETRRQQANGGEYFQFTAGGKPFASLYRLDSRQLAAGVPAHWTPYIGVADIDAATAKAAALGGRVLVRPFRVDDAARISLVADRAGALLGLWELGE